MGKKTDRWRHAMKHAGKTWSVWTPGALVPDYSHGIQAATGVWWAHGRTQQILADQSIHNNWSMIGSAFMGFQSPQRKGNLQFSKGTSHAVGLKLFSCTSSKKLSDGKYAQERGLRPLVVKEIRAKTTLSYQHVPIRMSNMNKTDHIKCWWGRGAVATPT